MTDDSWNVWTEVLARLIALDRSIPPASLTLPVVMGASDASVFHGQAQMLRPAVEGAIEMLLRKGKLPQLQSTDELWHVRRRILFARNIAAVLARPTTNLDEIIPDPQASVERLLRWTLQEAWRAAECIGGWSGIFPYEDPVQADLRD
jgi:hypothetical protein